MALNINNSVTNPRKVDELLEGAIDNIFDYTSTAPGVDQDVKREVQWTWNSTDTAAQPSMRASSWITANPSSNSESIQTALEGRVDWTSSNSVINNGHLIGVLGHVKSLGSGQVKFCVPMEARFDQAGAGSIDLACNILLTTGNITGTVNQLRCVYIPDMSGLTGYASLAPGNRYSFYSGTPDMPLFNAGHIVTSGRLLAASTTTANNVVVMELQQPNALAGVAVKFTVGVPAGQAGGTAIGSIAHNLISASQSEIRLNVMSNSVADSTGLVVQGNAGSVATNLGFNITTFGGGKGVMAIGTVATAPTTNPTGGCVFWFDGANFKYRDTAGTVKTITAA